MNSQRYAKTIALCAIIALFLYPASAIKRASTQRGCCRSRFVAKCVACRYGISVRDVCRLPVCPRPECRNVECPRASCLPGQQLIKATGRRGGCCDRCQGPPVLPPPPPPLCARRKRPAIALSIRVQIEAGYMLQSLCSTPR